jgi:hypothetical protein
MTEQANNHMPDEHAINARVGSPAHSLQTTPGGKIARRARLQTPAHTLSRYNSQVEKILELETFRAWPMGLLEH